MKIFKFLKLLLIYSIVVVADNEVVEVHHALNEAAVDEIENIEKNLVLGNRILNDGQEN